MAKKEYNIAIKKDGKFYTGYCLEIPQAHGQGNTRKEAIEDTKEAIKICKSYLESKKKAANVITVTI
ncbi:MAG: type II toxin-antitoxin system HicB family antitoxin [Candidatus Nitrosotenuis sp.]